jgi:hypothetical protein
MMIAGAHVAEDGALARPILPGSFSSVACRRHGGSAAAVVVAEVVILFARHRRACAVRRPLVWSDELASILFLWLAMLGSALAVQRGSHMRLTFLRVDGVAADSALGGGLRSERQPSFWDWCCHRHTIPAGPGLRRNPRASAGPGSVRALAILFGFVVAFASCLLRFVRHDRRETLGVIAVMA